MRMFKSKSKVIKQQLSTVNKMLKHFNDWDGDGDGIMYVDVDLAPNLETLKKLLPLTYQQYIRDYEADPNSGSIDITALVWGELDWGKNEIWFSSKEPKFYIVHWYHKVSRKITLLKRALKRKINRLEARYYNSKYARNKKRNEKIIIKMCCKSSKNK